MITITNSKLESFTPKWARFHGFSLLFDNPCASLRDDGKYATLVTDPHIDFYVAVKRALCNIGGTLLTNTYLFAPLPYNSYHVTVWDGINDSNLPDVPAKHQYDAATFIGGLPDSLISSTAFTQFIAASPLFQNQATLTFRFNSLYIWGNNVLVATLRPIEECITAYDTLKSQRAIHNDSFSSEFGTSAFTEYCPHVSLGYFANQESAQLALGRLVEWQTAFSETMAQETISFPSFSLYGFTDMVTFMKSKP